MERLGPLDATFLSIEDAVNHMHIGSVGVFDGPAPTMNAMQSLVESKLHLIPRYRQKVLTAPVSVGRPVWVDDPQFRVDYHVRYTALPSPGGHDELRRLMGRVMSQQLDRHKPLWEMWVVEGLADGRWALISKVHHCMVDGVAGSDLLAVVLDFEPDATVDESSIPPWDPSPEPSTADLALHSLSGLAYAPLDFARHLGDAVSNPSVTMRRAFDAARGMATLASSTHTAPESTLTGPIGGHRQWDACRVDLDDVKGVRKTFGCTVNDVVLALITAGFRSLLLHRGESVENREISSLIPVSTRAETARGVLDNRVSSLVTELPVGHDDPVERLGAIRDRLRDLKESGEATTAEVMIDGTGVFPQALAALTTRLAVHRQHMIETVTTNVPGPQLPLYALGRRMIEAFPYVPIAGHMRLNVAIWSYDGGVHFGLTADADDADDLGVMTDAISAALEELLEYAV